MFMVIELDEAMRKRRAPKQWLPMIERWVRGLLEYFRGFENEIGLLENWRAGCSANGSSQRIGAGYELSIEHTLCSEFEVGGTTTGRTEMGSRGATMGKHYA